MEVSDLARPYFNAVVVELIAEEETGGEALIPAERDDGHAPANDSGGLVQRPRAARAFERDGDPVSAVRALQFPCDVLRTSVERNETERLRDGEALRYAIDGVHGRGARRARDLRNDQADRPAAEDDRGRARVPLLGVRHGVHRDGQHLRQISAVLERKLARQKLRTRVSER